MIITKVKLNPFGALSNRNLSFEPGLNTIWGDTGAGKSTVFNAIQKVLFTPAILTDTKFKSEIARFLPIGVGDTVSVELHFDHNRGTYILNRIWGATQSATLELPDGSVVTDETAISQQLESFLYAKEGTYKSVLMTSQSGLSKTLDELTNDRETVQTLGDILRKAVQATDGVSIDKFREQLQSQYDDYFKYWDREQEFPKDRRGIENPFKFPGIVLSAFYKKETIKKDIAKAQEYEEALDRINQQIAKYDEQIEEKENYIEENAKAVEDARQRRPLNAELEAIQVKINNYEEDKTDWPVVESNIDEIKKQSSEFEEKKSALEQEQKEAEKEEKNKKLRESFERVKEKKQVKKLTIAACGIMIGCSLIWLWKPSFPLWIIVIPILFAVFVIFTAWTKFKFKYQEVEKARKNYKNEVGEYSYEELELSIEKMGQEKETRSLTDIAVDLANIQKDIKSIEEELDRHHKRIAELEDEYESYHQLRLYLAEVVKNEKDIQEQINNLTPLPEGVDDVELFIQEYDEKKEELESEEKNRTELILNRKELEKGEPDESAEELEKQLMGAEEEFESELRRAEAITRIKGLTTELLGEMDTGTYEELKEDVEHYVSVMIESRFPHVEMEKSLPEGFVRGDGELLSNELLSGGEKDVLALALRLSMANHFLKETDGFLIMDDPLANLDPDIQKKASEVIREFASEKQILIFTCDPLKAKLLGGHPIVLQRQVRT